MELVSDAMRSRQFKPPTASLPPDDWFQAPGYFQFGMPWPWVQSSDPTPVVDLDPSDGSRSFGFAEAPRAYGGASIGLWRQPGSLSDPSQISATMANLYGAHVREVRKVLLTGSRALILTLVLGYEQCDRLLVDRNGYLYSGEFRVPAQSATAYRPHLDTMLASWQWL